MYASISLPGADYARSYVMVGYVDRSQHDMFNRERQRIGAKKADLRWQRQSFRRQSNEKKGAIRPQNKKS